LAGASTFAQAQNVPPEGLKLGQPTVLGDACNFQNTAAVLAPDGLSLSILFSDYKTKAGGYTGVTRDRKQCNVIIPVTVPSGYMVSIINIDYRGFNGLPAGARAQFNADYFFSDKRGLSFERVFYGPLSDNFLFSNSVTASTRNWSNCGASTNLRTTTSLLTEVSGRTATEATSSIDSADISASVIYRLQWQRCDGGFPGGGNGGGGNNGGYPGGGYNGACTISETRDSYGRLFYVLDRQGRVVNSARTYQDAAAFADAAARQGRCDGGAPGNGGGYPGGGGGYPGGGNGGGYPGGGRDCVQSQGGLICLGSVVTYYNYQAVGTVRRVDARSRSVDVEWNIRGMGYGRNISVDALFLGNLAGGGGGYYPPGNGGGGPGGGGIGSCQIIQGQAGTGQILYRVVAQSGAIVATAYSYNEAYSMAQRRPECRW
jgi:hypothetical protein